MDELKPPIFLVGNVRSGTSMTRDFFGMHPEVCTWNEPRTVWCYADPARKHDRFTAEDARPRVIKYIRHRFLKYQRAHGNLRVMEKTPANVLRIPYIRAIFPEAKLVYIIREPLANISSSELKWRPAINLKHLWDRVKETPKTQLHHYGGRVFVDHFRKRVLKQQHVSIWGVRYPGVYEDLKKMSIEEVIAKQWSEASRIANEDLDRLDPGLVYRVRYEDLVTNPVPIFTEILEHFDLEMTPELQRALEEKVDPNRRNKWRRFKPEVIKRVLPIIESEMKRHGYEPPADLDELAARADANGEVDAPPAETGEPVAPRTAG